VQRDAREKYVVAQVGELIIRLRPVGFDCAERPAACDDDGTIRARVEVAVQKNSATRLTYDDYMRFPDDGLRHEIIEGEHYVSPPPVVRHQRILLKLSHLMQSHLDEYPVGEVLFAPVAVLLSEFNIFEPDLLYLSNERDVYRRTGVREYWIVDPDQNAIDVYRWEGPESSETPRRFAIGEALTTPLIPGFVLPLDKLFGSEL
jgi:Uma2 family endonuclease